MGPVAFVRAAAMGLPGMFDATAHPCSPASDQQLGRVEDPLHPGEAVA
jgi:hypothetical protein